MKKNNKNIHTKSSWTNDETNNLKKLFPITKTCDLSKIFNRTCGSITQAAARLKLKKTSEFKGWLTGRRNKMVGRDLSLETLRDIASKYKSRSEFQKKDGSAYSIARLHGWLDEICWHMAAKSYSTPQLILRDILDAVLKLKSLYNCRKIIPPYELDIYYPTLKFAVEYNGKFWHTDNNRDLIKIEKLKDENITVLYITENNRNYERDIKSQLIVNLPFINKSCGTAITPTDINDHVVTDVYRLISNVDDLLSIAKNYTSFSKFVNLERPVYRRLGKLKMLDLATEHMADRRKLRNLVEVKSKIEKFTTLNEMIVGDFATYEYIKRNGLSHLIKHLTKYVRASSPKNILNADAHNPPKRSSIPK
jgi:hypothetical protein